MMKVGDRLPEGSFRMKGDDGTVKQVPTAEIFGGQKVVLVGVPGAFTSTCHNAHIPTFIKSAAAMKAKGVGRIAVLAVNDHHVMKAWKDALNADGIDFLADGSAVFSQAIGLAYDASASGMGTRVKRFAMIVEDGVVKALNVESDNGKVTVSGAEAVMGLL